ncbi:hypothetical protein CMQ_7251 [Grosmannia clavigera kw1407]|uniref:Uncharacterized protein n=1 Tax=Grosmannia clavigera (strain kw1407 / UAMH 11150) TaxID=655863 RepID=F0XP51_GROCL|nr:uncharacterized protein CMQ_7251 [Grosmannia clavigera kw1407]EFX00249.1 hypothetical protein CMQ_7251 [Grosmannia clavigera kw1407]
MDQPQPCLRGRPHGQTAARACYIAGVVSILACMAGLIVAVAMRHGESKRLQPEGNIQARYLPEPGPLDSSDMRKGPGGPWSDGQYAYYCGNFRTGQPGTIRLGAASLRAANVSVVAPAGGCLRVFCSDTSAVYVCNDRNDVSQTLCGYDIAWMAERLGLLCCDANHGRSAQLFHPTDRWNTVIGYGNCRHAADETPASFGVGNGGVNGDCVPNESLTGTPGRIVRPEDEGPGEERE